MRTIYKYTTPVTDSFSISLPIGAIFRHADRDQRFNDEISLWFEVDTDKHETTLRRFYIVGTGNPIPDKAAAFLATVMMDPFVWHLYGGDY